MSKTAKPDIDPEKEYSVRLKKPAKVGDVVLKPSAEEIRVKGKILTQIMDSVLEHKEA